MNFRIIFNTIVLLLVIAWSGNTYCQTRADSLLNEFNSTDNQLVKIKCLVGLGDETYDRNLDSSELVWQQALQLANSTIQSNHDLDEQELLQWKSEVSSRLGEHNTVLGHFEFAIEHLNQSISINKDLGDSLSLIENYTKISLAYYYNGDYNFAMYYSSICLDYYQRAGTRHEIANTYYDIAYIYLKLEEFKKSKEAFDNAMVLFVELENDLDQAYTLSGIAEYYIGTKNYEFAQKEAIQSIILMNQLGEDEAISIPYSLMGKIKIELGEYDSARYYLDKSQQIKSSQPDLQKTLENFAYYSLLYSRMKQWPRALDYANKLLEEASFVDDKTRMKDAYELLYTIYEAKNDYKNAFFYYKEFNRVENELSLGESRRQLLQAELEFENKEQHLQDSLKLENLEKIQESERIAHDAEIKAERQTKMLLYGGIAIVLLALIGFIRSNRINKRNNKIISGQNRKLTSKATLYKILKVCSSDQAINVVLQEVLNELVDVPWFAKEKKAHIFALDENDHFKLRAHILDQEAELKSSDLDKKELILVTNNGQRHYHVPVMNEGKILAILKLFVWENHQETADERNFLESISLLLAETLQRDIIEKNLRLAHMENMLKKKEIERAHAEVSEQNELLEALNNEITESINYAKRIQESILPTDEYIDSIFPNQFIVYAPRDIVGGDFYWVNEYKDGTKMVACVDCSGHGIPGAFMTMMGRLLLREICTVRGERMPDRILKEMDLSLRRVLRQTSYDAMQDGMDVSICVINEKKNEIHFSSAMRPIMIQRIGRDEIEKLSDIKFPIGGFYEIEKTFETTTFRLDEIQSFYLYSDGYTDQFGGERGKKFGTTRFINLLNSMLDKSSREQKEILTQELKDWKKEKDQIDDILVIGVKL